jgi:hypothetical protein
MPIPKSPEIFVAAGFDFTAQSELPPPALPIRCQVTLRLPARASHCFSCMSSQSVGFSLTPDTISVSYSGIPRSA